MPEQKDISTSEKNKRLLIVFVGVFLLCILYSVITNKKISDNGCGDFIINQDDSGNYVVTENKRSSTCDNAIATYTCDNSDYCGFYSTSNSDTLLLFDNYSNYSYNIKTQEKEKIPYLGDKPHYFIFSIPNANEDIAGLFVYAQDKPFLYKLNNPQESQHIDYLSGGEVVNISCSNVSYSKELLKHNYISCDGQSAQLLDINTFSPVLNIDKTANNEDIISFKEYTSDNMILYAAVTNSTEESIPSKHTHELASIDLSFITGEKASNSKYIQFFDTNLQPIVEKGDYYYMLNNESIILYDNNSKFYYTYNNSGTNKSREYSRVLDAFISNSLKEKYNYADSMFLSIIDTDNFIKLVDTQDNVIVSFPYSIDTNGEYTTTFVNDSQKDSSISIVYEGILYNYSLDNEEFSKEDISYITDLGKSLLQTIK